MMISRQFSDIDSLSEAIDDTTTEANLFYNDIVSLECLECNTILTSLDVGYNNIRSLEPLSINTTLHTLKVSYNLIDDLSPLRFNTTLTVLDISLGGITDLTPLRFNTTLTDLDISDNPIHDISPIETLTSLKVLSIGHERDPMEDLTPIIRNLRTNPHLENVYIVTPGRIEDREIITKLVKRNRRNNALRYTSLRAMSLSCIRNS